MKIYKHTQLQLSKRQQLTLENDTGSFHMSHVKNTLEGTISKKLSNHVNTGTRKARNSDGMARPDRGSLAPNIKLLASTICASRNSLRSRPSPRGSTTLIPRLNQGRRCPNPHSLRPSFDLHSLGMLVAAAESALTPSAAVRPLELVHGSKSEEVPAVPQRGGRFEPSPIALCASSKGETSMRCLVNQPKTGKAQSAGGPTVP